METPCIRHGVPGTSDETLVSILHELHEVWPSAEGAVRSLTLFEDGEIWATWLSPSVLDAHGPALTGMCERHGHGVRHLLPVDLDYDYQEDVPPVG